MLLHGKDIKVFLETPMGSMNATYEGLIPKFNRLYIQKEGEMSASTKNAWINSPILRLVQHVKARDFPHKHYLVK